MKIDLSNFSGWVIYEKGEIVATYTKENFYRYYDQEEIRVLKEKIDKAIEYIYRNWITYDEATKFTTFNEEMEVCIKEIKELLEILGDKE